MKQTRFLRLSLIVLIRIASLSSILNLKSTKHLKKMIGEELMPMAWNPKKWLDWCLSEEKRNRHNFY